MIWWTPVSSEDEQISSTSAALNFIQRQIPKIEIVSSAIPPTAAPDNQLLPQDTPTPVPTATIQLFDLPETNESPSIPPLVLGGGIAAILVILVFFGYLIYSSRRR